MADYAHSDMLVSTQWVDDNRSDTANIRIVESNEDLLLFKSGHIPEAVEVDWVNDLNHPIVRDYIEGDDFASLCARSGISNDTTVVFYGDKNNWWACYALWIFQLNGHDPAKLRIMDGGRAKWEAEGRAMATEVAKHPAGTYTIGEKNPAIRAFIDDALEQSKAGKPMVDVRSPQEFSGERTHMAEYPQEGVLRGGHIPGASNCPWARAVAEDGTFKSREELEAIYLNELGLKADDDVIAYCRIGERSSHTWFVLTYLLGFNNVRNYDGSWTEYGNRVGMPIEKDYQPA